MNFLLFGAQPAWSPIKGRVFIIELNQKSLDEAATLCSKTHSKGGFCYGPPGKETPISQASKSFWVRIQTLSITISYKLSIFLSKNNFKYN